MAGTLYVVATPIGNLEDITLRALRILKEVALVAAEDTRRTGNLLRHYGIGTPLISLHEHNEHWRAENLVRRLGAGESVALVSDAGTPGISDPGARFVAAARQAGLRVDAIPGASAVTAMLSASGLSFDRFAFAGFPPTRSKDRNNWFRWVGELDDVPVVCFEAPHRIEKTLQEMQTLLVERPIIIARELTKLHEEWTFATLGADTMRSPDSRGEFVLIIGPTRQAVAATPIGDAEIALTFGRMVENNAMTRREAIQTVAQKLSLSPRVVYAALERVKAVNSPAAGFERQ